MIGSSLPVISRDDGWMDGIIPNVHEVPDAVAQYDNDRDLQFRTS